jgi:hypothetical protein
MDLILFAVFGVLSLVLIWLGLWRQEHSEMSLIGFGFLFLLAIFLITSNVTYKVGQNVTTQNIYTNISNTTLASVYETTTDIYAPIATSSAFNKQLGYWLAVISVVGFMVVLIGTRRAF